MSRWQPIASMVTTAPSIAIRSSSFGMATISLDFSATFTCPSTRRWRAAKAETMWMGALPLDFWPERREVLPSMAITSAGVPTSAATQRRPSGDPGNEATLERLGVNRGEDVAQVIVRRRPIAKRPEAAQQRELLRPEPGDIDEGLRPGQHREQRQHKHLVERIHHLAALARVRQIVKIAQKNNCFSKGPTIRRGVHPRNPPSNQKGLDGFRASRLCHPLLRPIALRAPDVRGGAARANLRREPSAARASRAILKDRDVVNDEAP